MFVLFGSGEKVTTLQPENRQEQDVIFYFKISASAITRKSCTNYMRPSL